MSFIPYNNATEPIAPEIFWPTTPLDPSTWPMVSNCGIFRPKHLKGQTHLMPVIDNLGLLDTTLTPLKQMHVLSCNFLYFKSDVVCQKLLAQGFPGFP